MTIRELIQKLEELEKIHGPDVEVMCYDSEHGPTEPNITNHLDDDWRFKGGKSHVVKYVRLN